MLRVGLVGFGGIGAVHTRCWLALKEQAQLVAIADNNMQKVEKFKEENSVELHAYSDWMEMLKTEALDVLDICVPTFLHAPIAIEAMKWVKNIIVEKPVCLTEKEAQCMLEAQEKSGSFVQVAHVVRFMDEYAYLKKLADDKTFGEIVAGSFSRISPRPMWMAGHDDVARTGGMAVDMHIHDVDFIRCLMNGEPDKVDAWNVKNEEGAIQHIWSSYCYGDALLTAEASWDYPVSIPFTQTFRVRFQKAAVVLQADGTLTIYPDEGDKYVPEFDSHMQMDLGINVSDLGPYMNEIKYFVHTITSGDAQGISSLSEAIESFRLVNRELVM